MRSDARDGRRTWRRGGGPKGPPLPAPARGLEIDGLVIRSGRTELVHGAAFSAPAGAVTALLGPNGAGKSTILRAVAGVERPEAGRIRFRDEDLRALRRRDRARRVAFVEQDATTEQPIDVYDVVALGRTPFDHSPRWLLTNAFFAGCPLLAIECARAAILRVGRRYSLTLALVGSSLGLAAIQFGINQFTQDGFKVQAQFWGASFIPLAALGLLLVL